MRTQVEFKSGSFPAREGEEEEINPGRWGMALAEYIAAGVSRHGFVADVGGYEDWGVYIIVENAEFPVTIGCGNTDDQEFMVSLDPSKPEIKKGFFKRRVIDTRTKMGKLAEAIDAVLAEHDDIQDVCWHE